MKQITSLRIDTSLYRKICEIDPTGRKMFACGVFFIINEYFKMKGIK